MADKSVEITLTARDNASAEVEKVQSSLARLSKGSQEVSTSVMETGRAFRETIVPMKLMAGTIASDINPSLGSLVFNLGASSRAMQGHGIAVAGTVITLGVLGSAIGVLVARFKEATTAEAALTIAAKSFEFDALRTQITSLTQAADAWKLFSQGAGGALAKILDFTRTPGALNILDKIMGRPDPETLKLANDLLDKLLPFEIAGKVAQQSVGLAQVVGQLAQLQAGYASGKADLETYIMFQAQLVQSINDEADALDRTIRLQAEAARAHAMAINRPQDVPGIGAVESVQREAVRIRSLARLRAAEISTEEQTRGITGVLENVVPESRALDEEAEGFAIGQRAIHGVGGIRQTAAVQGLQIEVAQAQLATQRFDLSKQERAEAEQRLIIRTRDLAIAQAEGKQDQDALVAVAEMTAKEKSLAIQHEELARTDPMVGLAKGFRDAAEEFGALGTGMQQVARETASNMQRAFSDQFFSVITGDFKNLPNIAKQFTSAMLRTITDELARFSTGSVLNAFRGFFGGGLAAGVPSVALGGGGGGGGFGFGGPGIGSLVQGTGLGGGFSPAGPGFAGGSPGGGFSIGSLPTPPLGSFGSSLLPSDLAALVNFPLVGIGSSSVVVSGGQVISSAGELAAQGITEAGVAGSSAAAAGAATVGTLLGGALAAAGLAFTVYGALTSPPTLQNIALSGASGGLSGALLGASIGSIFPGIGTLVGGIVGAVGGGALGAGAAALGKGPQTQRVSPNVRSAQAAGVAAGALSSAIDSAQSLQDMVNILNRKWSPYNELNIVAWDRPTHWVHGWTNGVPTRPIARNNEGGPKFPDVATMLNDPRYLENLEIQVGPGGSATYNQPLTDKFKAKWARLAAEALAGPVGVLSQLTPDVQRFTLISGSQAAQFAGSDFVVSPDALRQTGMSDDAIELFVHHLRDVMKGRDLRFGPAEDFVL